MQPTDARVAQVVRTMLEIRKATAEDIDAVAAVHAAGWRAAFGEILPPGFTPSVEELGARHRRRFAERPGGRLVAEVEGRLRGFCFFGPSRDEGAEPGVAEIYVLFVAPESWRSGIGRSLVEGALAELSDFGEVTLWSAADNARANAFYEALGFSRDGARQTRPDFGNVTEERYRRALPRPPWCRCG